MGSSTHWVLSVAAGLCLVLTLLTAGCEKSESPPPLPKESKTTGSSIGHFDANQAAKFEISLIVPTAQAPKPTGMLPQGAACITPACHASLAVAKHIHGPVSEDACDACHADDIGGHKYPLKRDKKDLCTFCHIVSGTAPHQHKALEQGCTVCHDPHASKVKYLIKADSIDAMCLSCHRVPWKRFTHSILTIGKCTLCHQPHQSDNKMLLIGGRGPGNCYLCHEPMKDKMTADPYVHKPATQQCVTCHNPHSSDFPEQLEAPIRQTCLNNPACHEHEKVAKHLDEITHPHEAVTTGDRCANCHDAHAGPQPLMLDERMDKVCLQCHDKPLKARDGHMIPDMRVVLTQSKYPHGPVRDGQCSACHDAHGSDLLGHADRAVPADVLRAVRHQEHGPVLQVPHQADGAHRQDHEPDEFPQRRREPALRARQPRAQGQDLPDLPRRARQRPAQAHGFGSSV